MEANRAGEGFADNARSPISATLIQLEYEQQGSQCKGGVAVIAAGNKAGEER